MNAEATLRVNESFRKLPMMTATSVSSTESKSCVPAEVPKVVARPYPVGEWQTRAQVSTLLLPKPARISFCTR